MPIPLRVDFDVARLRLGARQSEHAGQVRRAAGTSSMVFPPSFTIDDETVRMDHHSGQSGVRVVSFTGIGGSVGGIQKHEFRRSLGSTKCNALSYIIDKQRSWFNDTTDCILGAINAIADSTNHVIALGNSMGGFGAIYHAGLFTRCRRAVAFVPQYSANPLYAPSGDRRWPDYTDRINHRLGHAMETVRDEVDYHLFFGRADKADMEHAALFRAHSAQNVHIYSVPGGHDVAKRLKEAGCLPHLISLLVSPTVCSASDVSQILDDANVPVTYG